jgi:V/A-type H+-transporting ATPase subunit D
MGPEQAPTRAAVLELRAERVVVEEAYDFLDEKRLLLAAELLSQLESYQRLLAELEEKTSLAHKSLVAAIKRHGLQGLSVYPATANLFEVESSKRNLMGVALLDTTLTISRQASGTRLPPSKPSLEARQCQSDFLQLLDLSAVLAGVSGNLHRLFLEYRLTERRARALENVILPDIEESLGRMSAYLEEMDLEDAIRARPRAGKSGTI